MKRLGQPPAKYDRVHRTHLELFDGEAFSVTHTATMHAARAIEAGRANQVDQLVFANGSFTGRTVLRPLVEGLVSLAARGGRKLEVTTYDDPLTGSRAYGQSYRTERYLHVLQHVMQRHAYDTDHPLALAGQSRGWLTVVQAAHEIQSNQKLSALTGMAPVGHTPRDIEVNPRDVMHVLGMTWGELTDERAQQRDRHALAVKAGIARNALQHTVGNALRPWTFNPVSAIKRATLPMFNEVHEILTTDVTNQVVDLSKQLGSAVTLLACRYDRYAPGEQIVSRFAAIPEFTGTVALADLPHNGSLLDSTMVPELYGFMMGEEPVPEPAPIALRTLPAM